MYSSLSQKYQLKGYPCKLSLALHWPLRHRPHWAVDPLVVISFRLTLPPVQPVSGLGMKRNAPIPTQHQSNNWPKPKKSNFLNAYFFLWFFFSHDTSFLCKKVQTVTSFWIQTVIICGLVYIFILHTSRSIFIFTV